MSLHRTPSTGSDPEKAHASLHEHAPQHSALRPADDLDVPPPDAVDFDDDPRLSPKTILAVVAGALGCGVQLYILLALSNNIVNMAKTVGNFNNMIWYINCAAVGTAALGPTWGSISDLFGRKWILVFTQACGVVGGIVAGTAKTDIILMLGATILGLSLASQALFYAIPSETLPRKWRAWGSYAITVSGSLLSIAAIMSVGGLNKYLGTDGWRWALYITTILLGITTVVITLCYFPPPRPNPQNLSVWTRLCTIDFLGIAIMIAGVLLFLIGLNWGGGSYPWASAHVIATIVVGAILMIVFVLYSLFWKKTGILNRDLFVKSRGYPITCFLVFVEGIVYASFSTYYGQETAIVWESDPVISQLRALPFFVVYVPFGPVVNWYATKYKDIKYPTLFGFICFTVTYIGMSCATMGSGAVVIWWDTLAGIGFSAAFPLLIVLAQLDTPGELIGVASAFVLCVRVIGTVVGLTIYGVIVNAKQAVYIPQYVAPAVLPLGLPAEAIEPLVSLLSIGEVATALTIPGFTPEILGAAFAGYQRAILESFRYAWIASVPFCVVGVILCFFLPNVKARFDGRIDRPMDVREK